MPRCAQNGLYKPSCQTKQTRDCDTEIDHPPQPSIGIKYSQEQHEEGEFRQEGACQGKYRVGVKDLSLILE